MHDGCTKGSILQASQVFDGPGRGLQCVANAVCAILHSVKIVPPSWKPTDIDEILHKGYMLYQYIGKVGRLLPSDIPGYIGVEEMNYGLIEMKSYIGSFTYGQKDFNITTIDMLRDVFKEFRDFLLCIGKSASAILRHGGTYYMYDPHSRNIHGLPDANGSSILLTFHSFDKLSNYFRKLAKNLNTDQFELTAIKIVVGLPDDHMEHYITYKKQSKSPTSASRTSSLTPTTSPICTTSSPPSTSVIMTSGILSCLILIHNSLLFLIHNLNSSSFTLVCSKYLYLTSFRIISCQYITCYFILAFVNY